jgi:hypothetical protein
MWGDNIKHDLRETDYEGMKWNEQDGVKSVIL